MKLTKDETMIGTDMAMIYEFNSDPDTGFVSGCSGLDEAFWRRDNIVYQAVHGKTGIQMKLSTSTTPNHSVPRTHLKTTLRVQNQCQSLLSTMLTIRMSGPMTSTTLGKRC
eukprot:6471413-Amphidinium_carterae.1